MQLETLKEWAQENAAATPQAILQFAADCYENIALSFSGEHAVLVDMISRLQLNIPIFCLDTGRLHPETYRFIEEIRVHYGVKVEVISPEAMAVEQLVNQKGLFSFYQDGHQECCNVRKVQPLQRKLASLDAWVTGQRRNPSVRTRSNLKVAEPDPVFSSPKHALVKFNPLANWTSEQLWEYIREHDAPCNPLHSQGYASIGCEPCTRPILPHQHEREGRWWWESTHKKECGLHVKPLEMFAD